MYSPLLAALIEDLCALPGVGQKTAQRMAFYLLERDRQAGSKLANSLTKAMSNIGQCHKCRNLSETNICHLCANQKRDISQLCILESPADIIAIEQTGVYRGHYFVLMGHLSPIDGIGPNEIGIDQLTQRFDSGEIREAILATNTTVEGEATAHYIAEIAKTRKIQTSRIATGIPIGGELEYIDAQTLNRAFMARESF
ncbi:MAG: recombination mediator RecR [Pseudomonadota bacterium]